MSSETSTDARRPADAGLQPRHLYILMSMAAATVAVVLTGRGHPLALIVLSLTVVAAGLTGLALQGALSGFFGVAADDAEPPTARATGELERERMLTLRSIKELEFDRAMGKVGEADFTRINAQLRARAIALMQDLDHSRTANRPAPASAAARPACPSCGTANDRDARFCKQCGGKL